MEAFLQSQSQTQPKLMVTLPTPAPLSPSFLGPEKLLLPMPLVLELGQVSTTVGCQMQGLGNIHYFLSITCDIQYLGSKRVLGWEWHLRRCVVLFVPLLARAEWLSTVSPFVQLSHKGGAFSLPFLPPPTSVSKPAFWNSGGKTFPSLLSTGRFGLLRQRVAVPVFLHYSASK